MEDPGEEWEVQEYSPSEGSNSKVRWILDKGLNLGSKIVITGVVISSAPLVLPPLVVISALGFVFSVPFALVFASHACTEKLMSKLLPGPKSSLMFENRTLSEEEIEEQDELGFGGNATKREEKVQMEDGEVLEVEDEYWGKGDVNYDQEPVLEVNDEIVKDWWGNEGDVGGYLGTMADEYGYKSTDKGEEEPTIDVDEKVKEEGYEEDVGEDLEGEDKEPLERTEVKNERNREDEEEEPVVERSKREQEEEKNGNDVKREVAERRHDDKVETSNKEEGLEGETSGLLEQLRDDGGVGNPVEKDNWQRKEMCEIAKDVNEKNLTIAAEMEKPLAVKSGKSEKLTEKKKGGKKKNKWSKQNKEIQQRRAEESMDVIETNKDEKTVEKVIIVEKPIGDVNRPVNGNRIVKVPEIIEERKPVANKKAVMQSRGTENQAVSARTEDIVSSSAEFDDQNVAGEKFSYTTHENPEEHQNISALTPEGNCGFSELHVPVEVPDSKHAGIDSEVDNAISASKVPALSEEKIWEHIEALRAIVGYKAARRATCVEEIKALYIFTGVEPPADSFKNPSYLVEVNDKLQFLMSIVGVK